MPNNPRKSDPIRIHKEYEGIRNGNKSQARETLRFKSITQIARTIIDKSDSDKKERGRQLLMKVLGGDLRLFSPIAYQIDYDQVEEFAEHQSKDYWGKPTDEYYIEMIERTMFKLKLAHKLL